MSTPERLCVTCVEFDLEEEGIAYSDLTPGEGARIFCKREVWEMFNSDSTEEFRKNICKAATCKHFKDVGER
jgi:hypothetical protein